MTGATGFDRDNSAIKGTGIFAGVEHSPGPWSEELAQMADSSIPVTLIRAADGDLVCQITYPEWREHQANARLILAAPLLLTVAKAARDVLAQRPGNMGHAVDSAVVWNRLREAIAQAEGSSA